MVFKKEETCPVTPIQWNDIEQKMQHTNDKVENLEEQVEELKETVNSQLFESLIERLRLLDLPTHMTKSQMEAIMGKLTEEDWQLYTEMKKNATAKLSDTPNSNEKLDKLSTMLSELNNRMDLMEQGQISAKAMEDRLSVLKVQLEEVSSKSNSFQNAAEENKVLIDTKQKLGELSMNVRSNEQQTNLKIDNLEKKLHEFTKQDEKIKSIEDRLCKFAKSFDDIEKKTESLQASFNEGNARIAKITSLLEQTERKNQTTTAKVDNLVNKVEELARNSKKSETMESRQSNFQGQVQKIEQKTTREVLLRNDMEHPIIIEVKATGCYYKRLSITRKQSYTITLESKPITLTCCIWPWLNSTELTTFEFKPDLERSHTFELKAQGFDHSFRNLLDRDGSFQTFSLPVHETWDNMMEFTRPARTDIVATSSKSGGVTNNKPLM